MPRKPRKPRIARQPISAALLSYFETGGYDENADGVCEVFLMMLRPKMALAWETHRAEILTSWVAANPCSRPWAWWRFDAPEPRRRIGGTGDTFDDQYSVSECPYGIPDHWVTAHDIEVYNGTWRDVHGKLINLGYKPGDFTRKAIDPANPPTFESEAAYLRRKRLLKPEERKWLTAHPEALTPEIVGSDEDETPAATLGPSPMRCGEIEEG